MGEKRIKDGKVYEDNGHSIREVGKIESSPTGDYVRDGLYGKTYNISYRGIANQEATFSTYEGILSEEKSGFIITKNPSRKHGQESRDWSTREDKKEVSSSLPSPSQSSSVTTATTTYSYEGSDYWDGSSYSEPIKKRVVREKSIAEKAQEQLTIRKVTKRCSILGRNNELEKRIKSAQGVINVIFFILYSLLFVSFGLLVIRFSSENSFDFILNFKFSFCAFILLLMLSSLFVFCKSIFKIPCGYLAMEHSCYKDIRKKESGKFFYFSLFLFREYVLMPSQEISLQVSDYNKKIDLVGGKVQVEAFAQLRIVDLKVFCNFYPCPPVYDFISGNVYMFLKYTSYYDALNLIDKLEAHAKKSTKLRMTGVELISLSVTRKNFIKADFLKKMDEEIEEIKEDIKILEEKNKKLRAKRINGKKRK